MKDLEIGSLVVCKKADLEAYVDEDTTLIELAEEEIAEKERVYHVVLSEIKEEETAFQAKVIAYDFTPKKYSSFMRVSTEIPKHLYDSIFKQLEDVVLEEINSKPFIERCSDFEKDSGMSEQDYFAATKTLRVTAFAKRKV